MDRSELLERYASGERDFSLLNLSGADLSGTNLSKADFCGARLREADLCEADLREANLSRTSLQETDLSGADLNGADLREANLSYASLSYADLSYVNLSGANLSEAELIGTNLNKTDLSYTYLKEANLSGANLSEAILSETKLLNASLKEAELTGACIQDWHTNSQTDFDNVFCDYIYLQLDRSAQDIKKRFIERRPHSFNKFFASGEFTKFVKKTTKTVDLIFSNGVDWKAFLSLFQKLQAECKSDELSINSFENKGDGTFVIRINVSYGANKPEIEKYLKQQYQLAAAKSQAIATYEEQSTNLLEMARIMANAQQPAINVEAEAIAEN